MACSAHYLAFRSPSNAWQRALAALFIIMLIELCFADLNGVRTGELVFKRYATPTCTDDSESGAIRIRAGACIKMGSEKYVMFDSAVTGQVYSVFEFSQSSCRGKENTTSTLPFNTCVSSPAGGGLHWKLVSAQVGAPLQLLEGGYCTHVFSGDNCTGDVVASECIATTCFEFQSTRTHKFYDAQFKCNDPEEGVTRQSVFLAGSSCDGTPEATSTSSTPLQECNDRHKLVSCTNDQDPKVAEQAADESSSGSSSSLFVAAVVLGCLVGVALLCFVVMLCYKKHTERSLQRMEEKRLAKAQRRIQHAHQAVYNDIEEVEREFSNVATDGVRQPPGGSLQREASHGSLNSSNRRVWNATHEAPSPPQPGSHAVGHRNTHKSSSPPPIAPVVDRLSNGSPDRAGQQGSAHSTVKSPTKSLQRMPSFPSQRRQGELKLPPSPTKLTVDQPQTYAETHGSNDLDGDAE